MAASTDLSKRSVTGLASMTAAVELITALNNGIVGTAQSASTIALVKIATSVSTTVDFAALAVNDVVLILPAALGTAMFVTVVTAGTLPQAAVVGSLYVALRPLTLPAAPVIPM